jgi:hypothetical protein
MIPNLAKRKPAPPIPLDADKPSLADRLRLKQLPRMLRRVAPAQVTAPAGVKIHPACPGNGGYSHQFQLEKKPKLKDDIGFHDPGMEFYTGPEDEDPGRPRCYYCRRYESATPEEVRQYELEDNPNYSLAAEEFDVPCHRGDCLGDSGFYRCSEFHERCEVCERKQLRPRDEWGTTKCRGREE